MALIKPDFSETSGTVTPGSYSARITDSEVKESKAGKQYVRWTFETFDCANPLDNGTKVFTNTMVTGPGAFRLRDLCRAATGEVPAADFDTAHIHGREVTIVVEDGTDQNGQKTGFSEVKHVRKLG